MDGEATASGQIIGSPDYMAPEQVSNPRQADARADVYALGCTLYFLLAGSPPFGNKGHNTIMQKVMAHANEDVVPIQQVRPDVPGPLAAILDAMLAKNPADRCSTAAEVAHLLAPFCDGSDLAGLLANRKAMISPATGNIECPQYGRRREPAQVVDGIGLSRYDVNSQGLAHWPWAACIGGMGFVVWVRSPWTIPGYGAIGQLQSNWQGVGQHAPTLKATCRDGNSRNSPTGRRSRTPATISCCTRCSQWSWVSSPTGRSAFRPRHKRCSTTTVRSFSSLRNWLRRGQSTLHASSSAVKTMCRWRRIPSVSSRAR